MAEEKTSSPKEDAISEESPVETPPETEEEQKEEERVPEEITILDTDLEKLASDAKTFKDKYLRLLAETENTRKRLHKEKQDMMKFAVRDLILEFLLPIDHMENALAHSEKMSDEVKHWVVGFKMILSQFKDVLANYNVHPFEAEGTMFDPHLHDAVEMVETDEAPDGTIIEELVRGYKMGDTTIRPARVRVAKVPKPCEEEEGAEDTP